jgi:tol-pal system protein YbgF
MKSWRLCALVSLGLGASTSHAALFEDDEARRAILDLRQRLETQRQAQIQSSDQILQKSLDQTQKQIELLRKQLEVDSSQAKQDGRLAALQLQSQIEALKQEIANLRGEREQLLREINLLQRAQKDAGLDMEDRFQKLYERMAKQENPAAVKEEASKANKLSVQVDGFEFLADPEEKRDFEAAFVLFRKGDFSAAAKEFGQFVKTYSVSGYKPSALYWLGSSKFARRDFNEAIAQLRNLATDYPNHARAPEAMLTIGNAQIEIKQSKEARKTFNELLKLYPATEAAAAAKDRLAQLK